MGKHLDETQELVSNPPIWRTKIALSAVLMLIVTVLTVIGFRWLTTEQASTPDPNIAEESTPEEPFESAQPSAETIETNPTAPLVVHVAGEVENPGIVELGQGDRVIDAIEGAHGPTEEAQLDALNLAAPVNDGEYILVPDRNQTTVETTNPGTSANGPPGTNDTATVNINTAQSAELETLPGIGPVTAGKIIAHREQHGSFNQLADLEAVSGIGPATLEQLDGLVSW